MATAQTSLSHDGAAQNIYSSEVGNADILQSPAAQVDLSRQESALASFAPTTSLPDSHAPLIPEEVELPAVVTMKTHTAPSKARLGNILASFEKLGRTSRTTPANARPDYPQPLYPIDTPESSENGASLSLLSPKDYWARVDTYQPDLWFGKPVVVSPLVCSRFGWKLCAEDVLVCVHCKKQLIFQSSEPSQLVSYTQQFLGLLQTTHLMECPFSSKICISEDVFALKARPSSYLVHGFYEKLFDLQQVVLDGNAQAAVINVNCDSISNYTKSNGLDLNDLCKRVGLDASLSEATARVLFCAALSGWVSSTAPLPLTTTTSQHASSNTSSFNIKCLHCRRSTTASITRVAESDLTHSETADVELPTPASKRAKTMELLTIDPLSDHRPYCPWINLVSGEKLVGWQVCLRSVVTSLTPSLQHKKHSSSSMDISDSESYDAESAGLGGIDPASVASRVNLALEKVQSIMYV